MSVFTVNLLLSKTGRECYARRYVQYRRTPINVNTH